jgi:hypothetical protein
MKLIGAMGLNLAAIPIGGNDKTAHGSDHGSTLAAEFCREWRGNRSWVGAVLPTPERHDLARVVPPFPTGPA